MVAISSCELDRGLGDEAIISHRGLMVKCECQAVYVRGEYVAYRKQQRTFLTIK